MIAITERDGIAIVTLAHGKANTLDTEFCAAVTKAFVKLKSAKSRAVVLTGQDGIFSAGVNLIRARDGGPPLHAQIPSRSEQDVRRGVLFRKARRRRHQRSRHRGWLRARLLRRHRLMAQGAGRIGITELLVGLPFPALAFEVMRFVAMPPDLPALLYTGETFSPADAIDRGLIDDIVEPAALLDRAVEAAQRLAALSPQAFAVTKQQLRLDVTDRMKKHGRRIDTAATKIWASAKATRRSGSMWRRR